MVSTWKKSAASNPAAWARGKVRQLGLMPRGAGPIVLAARMRRSFADAVAEPGQFSLQAAMSPPGVLPRDTEGQLAELGVDSRASRRRWVGPFLSDEAAVPGQQGGWRDESVGE
jgi:hypothetical protein